MIRATVGSQKPEYLYLAVTADEYELPVCVADTPRELGEHYGLSANDITSRIYHKCPGTRSGIKFIRVEV